MTDIEYKFVDIIISKIPVNTPFMYYPLVDNLLPQIRPELDDKTFFELSELLGNRKLDVRKFLLENDYIKCVNESYPKDILTETGKKVKELRGHRQYLVWKIKQERQEQWTKIPAKKWLTILIFTNLFTAFLAPYILTQIQKSKSTEGSQLQLQIQSLRDSVHMMLHQPKETLYIQKNLLSKQKLLNK